MKPRKTGHLMQESSKLSAAFNEAAAVKPRKTSMPLSQASFITSLQ